MIVNSSVKQVPVDDLQSHPDNPRKGNVDAIVESIRANGFYGACVVQQSTMRILVGNHRWQAAKQAGLKKIPVVFVDVDDAQAKKILLADNRTSDLSSYDSEVLVRLLSNMDLEGTGYRESDLDALIARLDLPAPVEVPFDNGNGPGERSDSSTLQWGYLQWRSVRVRITTDEVALLNALYKQYRKAKRSDVGFGFHLVDDRVTSGISADDLDDEDGDA